MDNELANESKSVLFELINITLLKHYNHLESESNKDLVADMILLSKTTQAMRSPAMSLTFAKLLTLIAANPLHLISLEKFLSKIMEGAQNG